MRLREKNSGCHIVTSKTHTIRDNSSIIDKVVIAFRIRIDLVFQTLFARTLLVQCTKYNQIFADENHT